MKKADVEKIAQYFFPNPEVEARTRLGAHGPETELIIHTGLLQQGELDEPNNDEWEGS